MKKIKTNCVLDPFVQHFLNKSLKAAVTALSRIAMGMGPAR
jgi:hypothetical protein